MGNETVAVVIQMVQGEVDDVKVFSVPIEEGESCGSDVYPVGRERPEGV